MQLTPQMIEFLTGLILLPLCDYAGNVLLERSREGGLNGRHGVSTLGVPPKAGNMKHFADVLEGRGVRQPGVELP